MTKACAVTIVLNICLFSIIDLGFLSSIRIRSLKDVPNIAAHVPKIK